MSEEPEPLRSTLARAARRAYLRGIQTGDGGNVSARCPDGHSMLVSPSGGSLGDSTPASFLRLDFDGKILSGEGTPTREALLHSRIYALRADVNAIVHAHAPYSIAMAHTGDQIERVTWHARAKLPTDIFVVDVPAAAVRMADWIVVEEALLDHPDTVSFVLRDHGIVAMGSDPIAAEHVAELIEETAQIAYLIARK